jgi:DNA-binding response OmpR family regulator
MPDKNGVDLLKSLRALQPALAVVLMTAFGTIENAVAAMREGAYDYLTKPINLDELDVLLQRIMERHHLITENKELITTRDLPLQLSSHQPELSDMASLLHGTMPEVTARIESMMIEKALKETNGNSISHSHLFLFPHSCFSLRIRCPLRPRLVLVNVVHCSSIKMVTGSVTMLGHMLVRP